MEEGSYISLESVLTYLNDYLCKVLQLLKELSSKTNDKPSSITYVEPKMFKEAWYHEDPTQRYEWCQAINKEFGDMANHVVWKKIQRQDMPVGRQYIKSKCVLKIKRNGMFRARLVACGYSQIPGIDFTDNYSPVINNITLHLLLLVWLHFKLTAKIINMETAFLYVG